MQKIFPGIYSSADVYNLNFLNVKILIFLHFYMFHLLHNYTRVDCFLISPYKAEGTFFRGHQEDSSFFSEKGKG